MLTSDFVSLVIVVLVRVVLAIVVLPIEEGPSEEEEGYIDRGIAGWPPSKPREADGRGRGPAAGGPPAWPGHSHGRSAGARRSVHAEPLQDPFPGPRPVWPRAASVSYTHLTLPTTPYV